MSAGARFAGRGELRRLTRSRTAWCPLGYAPRWPAALAAWSARSTVPVPRALWGDPVRLPDDDLARHVLVVGLTGAHKTTAMTLPLLLEAASAGVSVVAFDLKYGEADSLALAAPEWWRRGRDVLALAPLDPASLGWNPLAGCRTAGRAHQLASRLFGDADTSDPNLAYWIGAERHVCASLILGVATDGEGPTFERIRVLCEAGPAAVQTYVRAHPSGPRLAARVGAYQTMLPKDQAGILQGIAARLDAWSDERVCRTTGDRPAWDVVDLDRLRRDPVLLLIGVPQAALARLRSVYHVLLSDLMERFLRPRAPGECVHVIHVIEELPAWGLLPGLADALATLRSRGVSVFATIQSEAQGEAVYGRAGWGAVAANLVTKIYCAALSDGDAESLSRALGTASVRSVGRGRIWGTGGSQRTEHEREIPAPLRRPEQLQGRARWGEEVIVRCPRLAPARLWCPPYYLRPEYRERVPDRPPRTIEITVRHHLRWLGTGPPPGVALAVPVEMPMPALDPPVTPDRPLVHGARPSGMTNLPEPAAVGATTESVDGADREARILAAFAARLLAASADEGTAIPLTGIHRGDRLVEVRVPSARAFDVLEAVTAAAADGGTSQILERWAGLRWVRRLRPAFVLERRALDALEPSLRERLRAACEPARVP